MAQAAKSTKPVRISRYFDAPAEEVFDAWINPASAKKWLFATPDGEMIRAEIDPRKGGQFVFIDRRGGENIEHVGDYLEIDRPEHLVFTFSAPKFSKEITTVLIDIKPSGDGCDLTLRHEGVLPDWAEKTKEGWTKILEGLARNI